MACRPGGGGRCVASGMDEAIELYKRDVDRTMIRENLKLTHQERGERFARGMALFFELRRAGARLRDAKREAAAAASTARGAA